MPPVGMVSKITWGQPVPGSHEAGAADGHRMVLQAVLGAVTATRVSQESRSPETSIVRRQVQGQAGKSSQLEMVRHSCKHHLGRNQGWESEFTSSSQGKKDINLLLTALSPQLSG